MPAPVRDDDTDDVQRGDGAGPDAESVETDGRGTACQHGKPLHLHLRHGGSHLATGIAHATRRAEARQLSSSLSSSSSSTSPGVHC